MQLDIFDNAIPTVKYFSYHNAPAWQLSNAQIDFVELTYIIQGQAIYTIDNQKVEVAEGHLLCIPKYTTRAAKSSGDLFEYFSVGFNMQEDVVVPMPLLSQLGVRRDILAQYHMLGEDWLSRSPGYIMRSRALFMLILQRILAILVYDADAHQFDPRVKQAISYMTENYAEHLTIATVAKAVSLNPVYFGALFKKETQVTFRDYLNTIRLNQAEDMLRSKKFNVTETAQNCGFSDVFYFSRLFKKHKGISPSAMQ